MGIYRKVDATKLAKRVSNRVRAKQYQLDRTGRDRDDYQQLAHIQMLLASKKYKPRKDQTNDPKAYMGRVIENLISSCKREFKTVPTIDSWEASHEPSYTPTDAVQIIKSLAGKLEASDRKFLMDFVSAGYSSAQLWRDKGKPLTRIGFAKQVYKAKQRIRTILET